MKRFFPKWLAVLLILTLALGQGAFVPAMAAAMPVSHALESMENTAVSQHDCCPKPVKAQHHDSKNSLCEAACASMVHAVMPVPGGATLRYAEKLTYVEAVLTATSIQLTPDYPPPKA